MKKTFFNKQEASPRISNEPLQIGAVINKMRHSNKAFAKDFRKFKASSEGESDSGVEAVVANGPNKNTMRCVDVKTILNDDYFLQFGKKYDGHLMMDDEEHLLFKEKCNCTSKEKRNFKFFTGQKVTGTLRLEDFHVRLNFKEIPYEPDFNIEAYSISVMLEVYKALKEAKSLVEEMEVAK